MTVTIMAAVARNGVIGAGGGLPWDLPDDLRRFKERTIGHVLVMGRRTYESIGRPLPGRTTIVVTRQPDWHVDSELVVTAASIPEALVKAAAIDEEVFVVGGADVFAAALPLADRLELTHVEAAPDGDTLFPEIAWDDWREADREPGEGWTAVTYERVRPDGSG